jgi:phage terminase large subunit-like protein
MVRYLEEEADDDDAELIIGAERSDRDIPAWDLSCPNWWDLLQAGKPPLSKLPLDQDRVDQALAVFKKLRIPDIPGRPSFGEVSAPWVFDLVAVMFGAYDIATQQRMIRGYFAMLPKKNTKTTIEAGVSVTFAILNERPQAEMILTGPSHKISGRAYRQAKGMIALDPEKYLQDRFHVRDHLQTIVDRITESELRIQTFDESIVTGVVPSLVIVDELHLLGRMAKAKGILGQLTGGMVGMPDAMWALITTQSMDAPAGVFKSNLKVARGIRDGRIKGVDTLPFMYEFPEAKQKDKAYFENPDHWAAINPNVGRSVFINRLVKDLADKREKGDDEVQLWFSQHLNIEIGLGMHADRWAGADFWEGAADKSISFEEILRRCEVVVVGIDGGGLDDLLGCAVVGRCATTKRMLSWCRAWAHRGVLKRRQSEAAALQDFEKAGELAIVDRIDEAFDQVAELAARVHQAGLLHKVALDPAGVGGIVAALDEVGIGDQLREGVSQGWRLSGAIKDTEGMLSDGKLIPAAQALMLYCVGNAKVEASGNATVITKKAAGTAKIDPLVALFIAIALIRMNPQPARRVEVAAMIA